MPPELTREEADRLRAFERRGHDAMAPAYYDFFSRITALATTPVLDAAGVTEGTCLLDVATGPGALAAAALARGAQPIGIDLSPGMLELARRLHPGIEFREADVEHLPLADSTFDAVVCSFGLGHFPLPEAALAECIRVLKPGGRVVFAWWAEPSRQRIQGLFREAVADVGVALPADVPAGHSSLRFCETAKFLRLLEGSGLERVAIADHATTFRVESADALFQGGLSSMVLTGAAIRTQEPATQDIVRAAFVRRARAYERPDGLHVPIAFRIGSGAKPG